MSDIGNLDWSQIQFDNMHEKISYEYFLQDTPVNLRHTHARVLLWVNEVATYFLKDAPAMYNPKK